MKTLDEFDEKDALRDRQLFTDLIDQHTAKIGAKLDEILKAVREEKRDGRVR